MSTRDWSLEEMMHGEEMEELGFYELLDVLEAAARRTEPLPPNLSTWLSEQVAGLDAQGLFEELEQHLARLLHAELDRDEDAQRLWLRDVATLDLARRGATRLGLDFGSGEARFSAALRDGLKRLRPVVAAQPWLARHGRLATEERAAVGDDVLPWSLLPASSDVAVDDALLRAWMEGRLAPDLSSRLRSLVGNDEAVRTAYQQAIAASASSLHVTRWNPDHLLGLATTAEEARGVPPLAVYDVPHAGEGARVVVVAHPEGTLWIEPWKPEGTVVPAGTTRHVWGDEVTGEVSTDIVEHEAAGLDALRRAAAVIRAVAEDPSHPRALHVAKALARELSGGPLREKMAVGQVLFDHGLEDEVATEWIAAALDLRVHLELLASRVDDGELLDALALADTALAPHAGAVLLLDEERYRDAVDELPLDPETWWGAREEIDAAMTDLDVEDMLRRVGAERRAAREAPERDGLSPFPSARPGVMARAHRVELFDQNLSWAAADGSRELAGDLYERAMEIAYAQPCPWLSGGLHDLLDRLPKMQGFEEYQARALAERLGPKPGRTPLLLHDGAGAGRVAELRIRRRSCGDGTPLHRLFGATARDALRDAHRAAARLMPGGLAPAPLGDHEVQALVEAGISEPVDGGSLGLPAALAFLSLWLDQPLPGDLVATARLLLPGETRAVPVGAVEAKAAALAALWARPTAPPRLLVGKGQPERPAGVDVREVATLREAVELAGLDLSRAKLGERVVGVASRQRRLKELIEDVEEQRLDRFRECSPDLDPWIALGDELRILDDSLDATPNVDSGLRERARLFAALAYTHGGDLESAERLLGGVALDETTPPAVAVLWHIVHLGKRLDEEAWEDCHQLSAALDEWLAKLSPEDATLLRGRALGTQGRALMHERRLDDAIPLLREAVEHHNAARAHERARSRQYLAMALRMRGELDEALAELELARRELDEETRPYSESYYRTCLLYWRYERARLALDRGDAEHAVGLCEEALADTAWRGFWPEVGIRRTLAWALRALGRADQAAAQVTAISEAKRAAPRFAHELIDRLATEAAGYHRVDGEVY